MSSLSSGIIWEIQSTFCSEAFFNSSSYFISFSYHLIVLIFSHLFYIKILWLFFFFLFRRFDFYFLPGFLSLSFWRCVFFLFLFIHFLFHFLFGIFYLCFFLFRNSYFLWFVFPLTISFFIVVSISNLLVVSFSFLFSAFGFIVHFLIISFSWITCYLLFFFFSILVFGFPMQGYRSYKEITLVIDM